MRSFVRVPFYLAALSWLAVGGATGVAQGPVSRVAGPINEGQVVTLMGNVHPLARGDFDQGVVAGETALGRMVLELEPSAAQQAELDALVEAQDDPGSGLFHQWLPPQEYGARFGVSGQDMARITAWLKGHGFTVEEVAASNRLILFSGTAGQVADTFHTEIHRYQVDGVEHIANAEDPQIPAALSGVVGGVVSLHDFRRRTAIGARKALLGGNETEAAARIKATAGIRASVGARPGYTAGGTHYLFPADWATIYDLNPLYSAGTMGLGTSIAIVGRSNIDVSDVTAFRATSGLTANAPAAILAGADPGLVNGDQDESTLDVEWSGAIAPAAAVKFVVGDSTATTDGVDLSAEYIVNHATAPVVSTSYISCEREMGTTELAFYNGLWEQAASEGMSAFVSSGDAGAAGCYSGSDSSGSGTAVNGLCSSPYSTCVGGDGVQRGDECGGVLVGDEYDELRIGAGVHSGGGLERERVKWGVGTVGIGRRGERGVCAAELAKRSERDERSQWNAGGSGRGDDGGGARWVRDLRERIVLRDFRDIGGVPCVCRGDGAGGGDEGRNGGGECECGAVSAAERGERSVSHDAFREQQRTGGAGVCGGRRGL